MNSRPHRRSSGTSFSKRFFAEHLLNNRPQMKAASATDELLTQTKQSKIGLCEQVRVNWKTGCTPNTVIIVTSGNPDLNEAARRRTLRVR